MWTYIIIKYTCKKPFLEKSEVDTLKELFERVKKPAIIIGVILIGTMICGVSAFACSPSLRLKWYLNHDNCAKAVDIYNESLSGNSDSEEHIEIMLEYIENTKIRWKEGELSYREAVVNLENLRKVNANEVSGDAKYMAAYIEREGFGKECYAKAEAYSVDGDYINAMKMLYQIDENYLSYSEVAKLNNFCKDVILKETEELYTVAELEKAIIKMEQYFAIVPEPAFATRKGQLEKELVVLKDVMEIVKNASDFYDEGDYKSAFDILEAGLEKYPEHFKMEEGYLYYLEKYVEMIAKEAQEACEKGNYKEAIQIVEDALEVHECEALRQLLEHVKEEKSILYRWWNDMKGFFEKFN